MQWAASSGLGTWPLMNDACNGHQERLLANSATFSRFWNVPTLLKRAATTFSALGIAELSDTRGPYAGTFGMPLLSRKGMLLSSMLGLPLLLKPRIARR